MSELAKKTIHELAPLIARREVSPVELTQEMGCSPRLRPERFQERESDPCRAVLPLASCWGVSPQSKSVSRSIVTPGSATGCTMPPA